MGALVPAYPVCRMARCCSCCTLISKLRDSSEGGGRIGIILNGSPLFTGGAGSGESEIRRYILEADLVRNHRRAAQRYVLQHGHCHLCVGAVE